jgi:hypothetical protein
MVKREAPPKLVERCGDFRNGTLRPPKRRGGSGNAPPNHGSKGEPAGLPRCGQDVDGGVQGPPVPVQDQAALVPPERGAGEIEVAGEPRGQGPPCPPALFAS